MSQKRQSVLIGAGFLHSFCNVSLVKTLECQIEFFSLYIYIHLVFSGLLKNRGARWIRTNLLFLGLNEKNEKRYQPPERIELSTPGLQDQCSNPWATKPLKNYWSLFSFLFVFVFCMSYIHNGSWEVWFLSPWYAYLGVLEGMSSVPMVGTIVIDYRIIKRERKK